MVRDYKKGDLDAIAPNEFSKHELMCNKETFEQILDMWHSFTIESFGNIECIVSYIEYAQDCYKAMLVVGIHMSMSTTRQIKRFLYHMAREMKATRLETESQDNEILNRWHRFLGFEHEGKKRKYLNGRDYNIWGMVWE